MKIRIGRVAAQKQRCDLCGQRQGPFKECVLPYDKSPRGRAQYWDLCPACIDTLSEYPDPYVTLDKPLRSLIDLHASGPA